MRIIAGSARGRKYDTPSGLDTRPTLDRVKESVFGSIQMEIHGRAVLDLFAGSGGLGLESLSRGAKKAVFADNDRTAADIVRKNISTLGFEGSATVLNTDCRAAIKQLSQKGEKFDIVFLDPPYASGLTNEIPSELISANLLNVGALMVIEHSPGNNPPEIKNTTVRFNRKYHSTEVTILRYIGEDNE